MFFKDIIGQGHIKQQLLQEIKERRIPHAQLFCGPEGCGKLAMAIAYARYLMCNNPNGTDACGVCPACVKINKLAHPDLHFVFPVIKRKSGSNVVSDDYIKEWRELVSANPYFAFRHWLEAMGAENQQAQIFVKESDELYKKLYLKSMEGGYKIVILWLPEKMKTECANKLLKLLEEPPALTVFLLVSEAHEQILSTILSRTQRINIPKIDPEDIKEALQQRFGLQPADAQDIARLSNGNYLQAFESIHTNQDRQFFFELFVNLMRLAYMRKLKEIRDWSETVASLGRERQKDFLMYCQRMIRENFMANFHQPSLNYMNREEQGFSVHFAPFVNEKNIIKIMNELSEAQIHIEQNVNPHMVFFDFSLKMIVLLKQ